MLSFSGIHVPFISDLSDVRPFQILLFGGANGKRLPHVTRINMRTTDKGVILSIGADLDEPLNGETAIKLGNGKDFQGCFASRCPPPFPEVCGFDIRSADGERIIGLEAFFRKGCIRSDAYFRSVATDAADESSVAGIKVRSTPCSGI
jgi:hypothetical protein